MDLYIEYVILDNWVIDYILIRLIELTTGKKIRKINKFFVCFFGVVFAIFLPFLYTFEFLLFLYRIISSIVLVLSIKKYKKLKYFITYYLLFVAYTFLIGGGVLGVIQMLNINYSMSGLFMYEFEFPLGLFGLIVLVLLRIVFKLVKLIKRSMKDSNYFYNITITDKTHTVSTTGFFDSGNNIKFEENGVNIISINLFLRLYKDMDLHKVLMRKIDREYLKCVEYISISGIGEGNEFLSFKIDSLEVDGSVYRDTRVAVAMKNFGDYDCILHKDFVKG